VSFVHKVAKVLILALKPKCELFRVLLIDGWIVI